ncbi:MAG: hypothetical protein MJZ53_06940 [Paludibacteraceae bacterium]|nr:hypothetical protein [Paludibacteraceae bacterium]
MPNDIFNYVRTWVGSQDPMSGVVVCGNSSGVERYTLRLLLNKGFAVIVPLATTIPENLEELNLGWKLSNEESTRMLNKAFEEHRLLLVASKENVSVSVPTGRTLAIRNRWMMEAGESFVVALRRENDYFDRLVLGRNVTYLCEEAPLDDSKKKDALSMGWEIYRKLKNKSEITDCESLTSMVNRYLALDIEHPSLLHSLILMVIARNYTEYVAFDFMGFVRQWSIKNLRPEDWKHYKSKDGRYLPSLAEKCMSTMLKQMPSRNMMSLDYGRPFDSVLLHEWLDEALNRFPRNKKHLRNALKLAYFEHDREMIDRYQKMLAI